MTSLLFLPFVTSQPSTDTCSLSLYYYILIILLPLFIFSIPFTLLFMIHNNKNINFIIYILCLSYFSLCCSTTTLLILSSISNSSINSSSIIINHQCCEGKTLLLQLWLFLAESDNLWQQEKNNLKSKTSSVRVHLVRFNF